ncbi:MAG TPA: DUF4443 domain-containing protein [Nitrososphaerales archaeon]|nr:DUF4443 domain-containing protein [Nitrososphaerales archaeon]
MRKTLPGAGTTPFSSLLSPKEKSRGPALTFSDANAVLALLTVRKAGYIGRDALAKESRLGGGAVRTLVKKLKDRGFLSTNASGCYLTKSGAQAVDSLLKVFGPFVDASGGGLALGESQVAMAVRGRGGSVGTGIDQRDSAIRLGASGATTYVIVGGKFTIPGGSKDCERDFPDRAWGGLRKVLKPGDGDAVVLCGASDSRTATLGALAAGLTLL